MKTKALGMILWIILIIIIIIKKKKKKMYTHQNIGDKSKEKKPKRQYSLFFPLMLHKFKV